MREVTKQLCNLYKASRRAAIVAGTILLVFAVIMTLAACGVHEINEEEAHRRSVLALETYQEILRRITIEPGESGAYNLDFSIEGRMRHGRDSFTMHTAGNIQVITDGNDMRMAMYIMSEVGRNRTQTMEIYTTIEEGVFTAIYMAIDGRTLPAESLDPEMLENAFDIDSAINIPELTMEEIRSVEIEEIDGNTVIHIVLDGQVRADFVLEHMGNMFEDDTIVRGLSAEVDDILMTIIIDEAGNPVSSVEEMHAQIVHAGGGSLSLDMSYEIVFRAFGDDVEIETKVALPREVATKEFSDDLNSLTFYLNGTLHTLPVSFTELEDMGWEAPDFTVGPHARRGNVEITNGNQILVVHFSNFTDDRLPVSEVYVDGFFVPRDSEAQVIFPGNIMRGSTYEEVITTHGEPNTREKDAGNQTVLLRYRMDAGSVFFRVDIRTNLVISMNMGSSIRA